jgi:hypothetical protein
MVDVKEGVVENVREVVKVDAMLIVQCLVTGHVKEAVKERAKVVAPEETNLI